MVFCYEFKLHILVFTSPIPSSHCYEPFSLILECESDEHENEFRNLKAFSLLSTELCHKAALFYIHRISITMCEKKVDTTGNNEQTQGTFSEDGRDEANQHNNGVGKLDIGNFVHNQRKIRLLLGPWLRFYHTILNIVSWKSFYVSLFWILVSSIIAVQSPVYFVIIPLVYVSFLMVMSGIKTCGGQQQFKDKKFKYGTIKKKADDNDLNVKTTVEKQAHEDIEEFISLMIQLDALCTEICAYFEKFQRILKWEDFKTSICVLGVLLLAIFILYLIPIRLIMLSGILCLFCLNFGFRPVARKISIVLTKCLRQLISLLGLSELFPSREVKRLPSQSNGDPELEWFDAPEDKDDMETSGDEDESDSNDAHGDQFSSQKKLDSKSVLSQLADFRRKQKKLNSGTCSSCDVPFSSILKKRQYCRHCGKSFCSKCCSHRVKRSVFGATAPAAYEETVLVCKPCFDRLMRSTSEEQPGSSW